MKDFFIAYRKQVLIFIPILIAVCTFYSGNLGERISEIYTSYIIDITTLNNSFITLAINTTSRDQESILKTKHNIDNQMEQFNRKYQKIEGEIKTKETLRLFLNSFILFLALIQITFVELIPGKESL